MNTPPSTTESSGKTRQLEHDQLLASVYLDIAKIQVHILEDLAETNPELADRLLKARQELEKLQSSHL